MAVSSSLLCPSPPLPVCYHHLVLQLNRQSFGFGSRVGGWAQPELAEQMRLCFSTTFHARHIRKTNQIKQQLPRGADWKCNQKDLEEGLDSWVEICCNFNSYSPPRLHTLFHTHAPSFLYHSLKLLQATTTSKEVKRVGGQRQRTKTVSPISNLQRNHLLGLNDVN